MSLSTSLPLDPELSLHTEPKMPFLKIPDDVLVAAGSLSTLVILSAGFDILFHTIVLHSVDIVNAFEAQGLRSGRTCL